MREGIFYSERSRARVEKERVEQKRLGHSIDDRTSLRLILSLSPAQEPLRLLPWSDRFRRLAVAVAEAATRPRRGATSIRKGRNGAEVDSIEKKC